MVSEGVVKLVAIVLAAVVSVFLLTLPTTTQAVYTDYLCGSVETFPQPDGNTLVRCYPPGGSYPYPAPVTPTATYTATETPTSTATTTPTSTATETPTATATETPTATATSTATPTSTVTATPTVTTTPTRVSLVVGRGDVAAFERIPDNYLQAARNLRIVFSDQSVGQNINESLDCLTASTYGTSPSACRKGWSDGSYTTTKLYTQADFNAGLVPTHLRFSPDPVKYNRSNILYLHRIGDWSTLTGGFINEIGPTYTSSRDILSYQFSYLAVMSGSDILQFFTPGSRYDVYDLQAYMDANPQDKYFLWTTSLARTIGTREATEFNQAMRQYAAENNIPLLDMADIISHTPEGVPCYDPTGQYPAICREYTSEAAGGHLGSVSGGRIRMAKAFWVMLARLSGWNE